MAIDMKALQRISQGDQTTKVTVNKAWLAEVHRLLAQGAEAQRKLDAGAVLGDRLADLGERMGMGFGRGSVH